MICELRNSPFSLVLSGGGALGIAHLGVLHDLQQANLIPSEIIGTSMGGIIGACIAIGMREVEIYEAMKAFSRVSSWIKFSLSGNAIVDNAKIEKIFDALFDARMMHDTDIPLKIITTNLHDGSKRVFDANDSVRIKDALLATMAIPGIFDEHVIEDETYGDGFLCENLGLRECYHDNILAVDVLGKHAFETQMPDNFFKTANVLEMFERSMRLLIYNQTQNAISTIGDKKLYLLEPHTRAFKTFHFHKVDEIRALGLGLFKDS